MICSPILLVGRSRSEDSCTYFSTAFTILSSFDDGTGRFSQARNSPAMTLLRSKASRRPSFLITMYGISSMRSYDVKRRSHFKHSRRRRIASPSRDSRESTTLSSRKPQKGHFIRSDPLSSFYPKVFSPWRSSSQRHLFVFHRVLDGGCRSKTSETRQIHVAAQKVKQAEQGSRAEINQVQNDRYRGGLFTPDSEQHQGRSRRCMERSGRAAGSGNHRPHH